MRYKVVYSLDNLTWKNVSLPTFKDRSAAELAMKFVSSDPQLRDVRMKVVQIMSKKERAMAQKGETK